MQATRSVWLNLQQASVPSPHLEQATTSLSPVVTQIVHNRGIGVEKLPAFLRPELSALHAPHLLRGMDATVARIATAAQRGELVAVYGDFDVDGITAAAVLVQALTLIGVRAIPYIPHRQSEGSGLHTTAIQCLYDQGVRLVITVDCGITSAQEVAEAMASGLDVIITDHHCPPEKLPPALAIVDPHQPGCSYPFKDLAGVGVAFKLAQALLRSRRPDAPQQERALLDLVAIGTIADMAPLVGENRILVLYGMRVLNDTDRLGLQALIARSGLRSGGICSTDVGFRLCPRLNAAGRLDHASMGYQLLTASTFEEADALAQRLEEKNCERQALTQQALAAAHQQLSCDVATESNRLLIVRLEPWASGVMGLVAGKLVEEFGKPAVVLQECAGEVRGSARGTAAFSMLAALRASADLLNRFGGHQLAAGFTIDAERIQELAQALRARAAGALQAKDVLPTLSIDAEVTPAELSWKLYDQLQALEPCGIGNPLPLFLCRHLRVFEYRRVGNNHLRMTVGRGCHRLSAIVFRRGDLVDYLQRNIEVDLVFSLEANDWNGSRNLQLRVRDMAFESACRFALDLPAHTVPIG